MARALAALERVDQWRSFQFERPSNYLFLLAFSPSRVIQAAETPGSSAPSCVQNSATARAAYFLSRSRMRVRSARIVCVPPMYVSDITSVSPCRENGRS